MYFLNYRLRKTGFDKCLKYSRFRPPFDKQHGKREQTLFKSERNYFYYIYIYILITVKAIWLEKVSLSEM